MDRRPAVCQAQAVRAMLARHALLTFSGGFARWLLLLISTILTLLGLRTSTPLLDRCKQSLHGENITSCEPSADIKGAKTFSKSVSGGPRLSAADSLMQKWLRSATDFACSSQRICGCDCDHLASLMQCLSIADIAVPFAVPNTA